MSASGERNLAAERRCRVVCDGQGLGQTRHAMPQAERRLVSEADVQRLCARLGVTTEAGMTAYAISRVAALNNPFALFTEIIGSLRACLGTIAESSRLNSHTFILP